MQRREIAKWLLASAIAGQSTRVLSAPTIDRKLSDVVVVGAGAFGAWTAYALRQQGHRVTLIDAYGPANNRSSSGDESRITRCSYGDQDFYTRWAVESLVDWKQLQQRSATKLFENTGVLAIATTGDPYLDQSAAVMQRLGIRFEHLSAAETMRRFPVFHLDSTESALFEPDSGALMAKKAIQALVEELVAQGVVYKTAAVQPPQGAGTLPQITTLSGETLAAGHFVFACGPWLPKVFPKVLGDRIRSDRAEVFFLGTPAGSRAYEPTAMPTWMDNYGVGGAYGFPSLEGRGCKVAVDSIVGPIDPDAGSRTVTAPYLAAVRDFVRHRFPELAAAPVVESRVCQYEMTADENYILDRHPDFNNVWIAGGGSGHGFKNAPSVGRWMAQLVAEGGPTTPLFSIPRPQPGGPA